MKFWFKKSKEGNLLNQYEVWSGYGRRPKKD